MRFTSFQAKNFKGISDTRIDINARVSNNIITLVGLNESGKTTLLEAIYSFSPDLESQPLLSQGLLKQAIGDIIPKSKIADFTDKIQIFATVEFEPDDIAALQKWAVSKKLEIKTDLLPKTFKIERRQTYKLSQPETELPVYYWHIDFSVKRKQQPAFKSATGQTWQDILAFLKGRLPLIAYYPTFIFDFPSKIYLSGKENDKKNNFYKVLFQDILDSQGQGFTIERHIISRIRRPEQPQNYVEFINSFWGSSSENQIAAVMDKVGATISKVVFEKWNEIFADKITNKEIAVVWKPEAVGDGARNVYVEFWVKDGTEKYEISERSLGFRWFFCFLLFTQFRASRKSDRSTIFIFDEPASNLHARAQLQLLNSFPRISGGANVLIYSTHSHYMINPQWLEQAYIIENAAVDYDKLEFSSATYKAKATSVHAVPYRQFAGKHPDQTTYFQPILDKLDYVPSNLDFIENAIFLEGKSDFYILSYSAKVLDTRDVHLIPASGASGLGTVISLYRGWGKAFVILLDGDKEGKIAKKKYEEDELVPSGCVFLVSQAVGDTKIQKIEDCLEEQDKALIAAHFKVTKVTKKHVLRFFQEKLATKEAIKISQKAKNRFKAILSYLETELKKA